MKTRPIPEAAVLDALPEAVLVADEDMRYVHANPAAVLMFGYPLDELLSMRVSDLVRASIPWTEAEYDRFKERGAWRGRVEIRRKDGSMAVVDAAARPLDTAQGRLYLSTLREAASLAWVADLPDLQHAVTRLLSEADDLDHLRPVLELIGTQLGWDVAELWAVRDDHLALVEVWSTPDLALSEFVEETRQRAFVRGEGLPGGVWQSNEVRWITEGFDDPAFLLGRDASGAGGLSSAFGVPLRSGDEVVGVLAAIARAPREQEHDLPKSLQPITGQLAQFIHRKNAQEALRESRDQLAAILEGVGDGITVQAPDGRLLYANEGAARTIGFASPEELVATPAEELMSRFDLLEDDGSEMPPERLPGRRALAGEEGAKELIRFRIADTGEERWSLVSASPVRDADGRVRFAINIFQDITERRRREARERFLGEVSTLLASSLDYETTLASVAQLAVSGVSDWCVVYVREEGKLRRLEVAHADPAMTPVLEELQRKWPMDQHRSRAILEVAETGEALLIPDIPEEMIKASAVDEDHAVALKRFGFRSAIAVPIRTGQRVHGVIAMISSSSSRRFDQEDLALAEELGRRAGVAVDHARVYRERSTVARTLQRSLLPPELPTVPGFEVAARYRAAKQDVGGDFYDVFPTGDGAWGVMVGDVCGKGAEAASLTALARYTVRAAAIEHPSPSETLEVLNDALLRQDLQGRFCTLVVCRLERAGGRARVQVASGGHPLPLLLRGDGRVEAAGVPGTLLGVLPEVGAEDRMVDLEIGDTLVLFTDGITDEFSLSGADLEDVLVACAGAVAGEVATRLEELALAEREAPRDDVALLVLRRTS